MSAETLDGWITVCLWVATICTVILPVLYSFSQWETHTIGRAFMGQSIAFGTAMTWMLTLEYWHPPFPWRRVISLCIVTFIAITTIGTTTLVWKYNFLEQKDDDELDSVPQ